MILTSIAKQIEAQSRARARRYETEYLANIFGLDWERSSLTLCSEQGARCIQSKESEAPSPSPLPSQGEELRRGSEGARQGARVRLRRIEYQVKNGCGFNRPNIKREMPLFEDIVSAVGEATHLAPAEIRGHSRRQRIAYARQLAMYLMRQITRASYPLIGDFFGRNHSTVIYACESIAPVRRRGPTRPGQNRNDFQRPPPPFTRQQEKRISHVKPLPAQSLWRAKGFRVLIMRTSQTRLLGSAAFRLMLPTVLTLAERFQIPLPVQGEGKRAWRARVRAASTQSLTSIQDALEIASLT